MHTGISLKARVISIEEEGMWDNDPLLPEHDSEAIKD